MATSKAKVTFTCSPELKDKLQQWADSESRTLSNLCELVMQKALDEHGQSNITPKKGGAK